jgi:hypothetical protein
MLDCRSLDIFKEISCYCTQCNFQRSLIKCVDLEIGYAQLLACCSYILLANFSTILEVTL